MRAHLFMFRTFRSRILALVLGLVTVVLSASLVAVMLRARAEVEHQATLQLKSAAETAREMMRFRGDQLTGAAEVLLADFGFKEAVSTGDTATLLSAIGNHGARIGADAVIVLDTDGHLIASTLSALSADTRNGLQALVAGQSVAELLRFYRLIDGQPYQIVLAPVLAPDPIGWTAIAFRLDDRLAADMARSLGVDVSFVSADTGSIVNVASSLPAVRRTALASLNAGAPVATPFFVKTSGDRLLTWTNSIRSNNGRLTLVLQRSMAEALRPYELLRQSILAIGAAALAVACVLCALFARSATQPIDALTRAAERLEAGDYSAHLPRAGTVELSRLASAFDVMRTAVADREATIRHQALHDGLTHLPTLTRISEILQEVLVRSRSVAQPVTVCLVEIQQLQDIIASLGHAAGDEVLWEVARRLTHANITERVARIATDRFLVVREGKNAEQARALANAIAEQLAAPLDYSGVSLQLESRIGVAVFPDDGDLPSELLQRAELALYRARESGATVGVFVRGDDESHRHRMAILGQLRQAIGSNQMELYYQPKVAVSDGRVVGCEALLRWRHPVKGFIPPSDFIPHAERTGMIRFLTAWVLSSALSQLHRWQIAGIELDMAINVSATDLANPGFVEALSTLLAQTRADPRRVVLEVTESAAMKDLPNALRVMEALRILGIRFAIDDFGTGYSSLAHLKRLPVDEIKIDQSFIRELEARPNDDVIVRSTINLGHALGLKVVAEGVEVAASLDALGRLGCDLIQGYLVSKPMPESEFTRWVTQRVEQQGRGSNAIDSTIPTALSRLAG